MSAKITLANMPHRWHRVLTRWQRGLTSNQISAITAIPRGSVLRIVRLARALGDPRAQRKP